MVKNKVIGLEERHKNILIEIVEKYLPEALIYLYGSRASGQARECSDVDIALDSGKKIEWSVYCKIRS